MPARRPTEERVEVTTTDDSLGLVANTRPQEMAVNPEAALQFLADCVKANPNMVGRDGAPIHWMVKDVHQGMLVCDSAFLMTGVNYSGIQFNIKSSLQEVEGSELGPMFKVILDYLASIVPESKGWAVEFKGDTPLIPTDRTLINA